MTGPYDPWRAASCQVRGSGHARCQDRAAAWTSPRPALCLLDGRGSAALSHIGARQAARVLRKVICQAEPELRIMLDFPAPLARWRGFARFLHRTAASAQSALAAHHHRAPEDFEFTLSVAIAGRVHAAWMIVGDSPLIACRHGVTGLIAVPEVTEYANETTFLSTDLPTAAWQCGWFRSEGLEALVAMSDGAASRMLQIHGQVPSPAVHQIRLRVGTGVWMSAELRQALLDPAWDRVTGDDRSLAVLAKHISPEPNQCQETCIHQNSPTTWSAHSIAKANASGNP